MFVIGLVAVCAALIAAIVILNEREMDERFPMTRKRNRTVGMSKVMVQRDAMNRGE